jgi:hypothetical protein
MSIETDSTPLEEPKNRKPAMFYDLFFASQSRATLAMKANYVGGNYIRARQASFI